MIVNKNHIIYNTVIDTITCYWNLTVVDANAITYIVLLLEPAEAMITLCAANYSSAVPNERLIVMVHVFEVRKSGSIGHVCLVRSFREYVSCWRSVEYVLQY